MPGEVKVNRDGAVSGWAYHPALPSRAARVRLSLDGEPLATVACDQPCATAPAGRAATSGFTYRLPPGLFDGRVHQMRARLAWGGELAGSPAVWEPRRPDAPARSFTLGEDGPVHAMRLRELHDGGADAAVNFNALGRSRWRRGVDKRLLQNRREVGGRPEHTRYRTWPAYLAAFKDHYVDPGYGGIYRADGKVWQGSTYLFNTLAEYRAHLQILAGAVQPSPARTCLVLANSVRGTYFHWHLDCLAGLVMAREMLGDTFQPVGPVLNAWQRASLDLLGETVTEMDGLCRPEEVLAASHLDGRGIYPDPWTLRLFRRLAAARAAQPPSRPTVPRGPKLFISRRDAAHRVLANEDELWGALRPKGFIRFVPGETPYAEQIGAFAAAELIVASHGSALTNIGFCRPGTTVVEILPSDFLNGCFRYLAIAARLRHAWFTTDLVDPFGVDVAAFMDWCAGERLF
jgi:hypothetical protein